MPVKNLNNVYHKFEHRTNSLIREFEDKVNMADDYGDTFTAIHGHARYFMLIRLQALWGHFCRELILRSAIGGYSTVGGIRLHKGTLAGDWNSIQNIVARRSNRGNPAWHIPNFSIDIARSIGIQNYRQVSTALGGTSPLNDVLRIRNYLVHPDGTTSSLYETVLRLRGMPTKTNPVDLLNTRIAGGASVFEAWITDLQLIAVNAVQ